MFILLKMIKRRVSPETWEAGQDFFRRLRGAMGYQETHWVRKTQVDSWRAFLGALPVGQLDVLEISPADATIWRDAGYRSYTAVQFPDFDVTKQTLPRQFDVIIADQVFEHLRDPARAALNVRTMLKDDGVFMLATPFLIRIHAYPNDYTRWTLLPGRKSLAARRKLLPSTRGRAITARTVTSFSIPSSIRSAQRCCW